MIEQRSLFEGDSVCLMDPAGIISVSGVDRLTWLHSLLSQNLKNLKPGESTEALLLTHRVTSNSKSKSSTTAKQLGCW
jgi:folate-binding Fe-S cluster repair protein YgfZ